MGLGNQLQLHPCHLSETLVTLPHYIPSAASLCRLPLEFRRGFTGRMAAPRMPQKSQERHLPASSSDLLHAYSPS